MRNRWRNLRYWQKGALLGLYIYLILVILITLLTLAAYWFNPSVDGEFNLTRRHVAEVLGFVTLIILGIISIIPISILKLFGFNFSPPVDSGFLNHIGEWAFYLAFSAALYGLIGAVLGVAEGILDR